jgi:predicted small lipoprotein YifL
MILIVKPAHRLLASVLMIAALLGCGQRGPLYLPDKSAPGTASAPAKTAPADRTTSSSK